MYSIGLHVHQVPSLKLSAEYREVSQILAEWAADRAEVREDSPLAFQRGLARHRLRSLELSQVEGDSTKAKGDLYICAYTAGMEH